jgi:hypothetical protein
VQRHNAMVAQLHLACWTSASFSGAPYWFVQKKEREISAIKKAINMVQSKRE